VTVFVSDNGPGVPEKIRDRLFQPFETYGKENGTGLGLAMSRRLVSAHGGRLELLESQGGACFAVVLG
jgi:signal transduction histidine kinase